MPYCLDKIISQPPAQNNLCMVLTNQRKGKDKTPNGTCQNICSQFGADWEISIPNVPALLLSPEEDTKEFAGCKAHWHSFF